jgi:hypothetical protein
VPSGDNEVVGSRSILVERIAGSVMLPAVDLDGDHEIRVRQVDPATPCTKHHSMLLHGLWQARCNERTYETHLKFALSRLIPPNPATEDAANLVGMATRSGVQACDAPSEIVQTQYSRSHAVIRHASERRHRETARQVHDRASHCCDGDALASRVLTVEKRQRAVRSNAVEASTIRA